MGGFGFDYVASSEELIERFAFTTIGYDWYPIDATRLLCLVWDPQGFSPPVTMFVVDHSNPSSIIVGALPTLDSFPTTLHPTLRPTVTKMSDSGDWLLAYADGSGTVRQFTISGTTIVPGTLQILGPGWAYGSTTIPLSLYDGHTDGFLGWDLSNANHADRLGIDADHYLIRGYLTWGGGAHRVAKWIVVNLDDTQPPISATFDPATLGIYADTNLAGVIDVGIGYWWTWAGDSGSGFTGPMGLALVEAATPTSLTVAPVTGFNFDTLSAVTPRPTLGVDSAGHWWLGALDVSSSVAAPYTYTSTYVRVNGVTTATTVPRVGEAFFSEAARLRPMTAMDSLMVDSDGVSMMTTDNHLRAERDLNGTTAYLTAIAPSSRMQPGTNEPSAYNQPPPSPVLSTRLSGMSSSRVIEVGRASDLKIYVDVFRETPLRPLADFTTTPTDPSNVKVRQPVEFHGDAISRGQSQDSYWHPILEYRWEWDDGDETFETSGEVSHSYARSSIGHIAGSLTADSDHYTGFIGEPGVYLPLILSRNSVGWSYAVGLYWIGVSGAAYQRSFPRDDALGTGSGRSFPPSTSTQSGPRSAPIAIT